MNTVYFFGYGAYRIKERLAEIIGKEPVGGYGAILDNYQLAFQTIEQIPIKPREIIRKVWGDTFRAYTIKPGKGLIAGVVWELEEEDIPVIKEWEYDGIWREFPQITIKTFSGESIQAITDKAIECDIIAGIVDGLNYEENLNKQGKLEPINKVLQLEEYKFQEILKIRKELEQLKYASRA